MRILLPVVLAVLAVCLVINGGAYGIHDLPPLPETVQAQRELVARAKAEGYYDTSPFERRTPVVQFTAAAQALPPDPADGHH